MKAKEKIEIGIRIKTKIECVLERFDMRTARFFPL
jgi:hypothetical protein